MIKLLKIIWVAFWKENAENGQYSIMISGHMDEVGFMVTKIDKHGFISFYASWWMGGIKSCYLKK